MHGSTVVADQLSISETWVDTWDVSSADPAMVPNF